MTLNSLKLLFSKPSLSNASALNKTKLLAVYASGIEKHRSDFLIWRMC